MRIDIFFSPSVSLNFIDENKDSVWIWLKALFTHTYTITANLTNVAYSTPSIEPQSENADKEIYYTCYDASA